MKLRIRGNSVRFRLSQTDMVQLAEHGSVQDSVEFGPGARLDFRIEVGLAEGLKASYSANSIRVLVPTAMAQKWAEPEEVAVRGDQPVTGDGMLSILLEKDFTCLTPREDEDDSDAFPNPASTDD